MRKLRKSIEVAAQTLLDRMGARTIPIPVDRIAKALGARVTYSPLDEELSGMVFIKDDMPIIGVNSLHHENRQRFTIAHEIAHLQLHREYITQSVHVDKRFSEAVLRRDGNSAAGTERLEIEANQFAAALLVPRSHLEELLDETELDVEDEHGLEELARKFKVSKAMLQYRIRNLAESLPPRRMLSRVDAASD